MQVVVILLALLGVLAGAWAALRADAQVAGVAAVLIGLAVLLPLIVGG